MHNNKSIKIEDPFIGNVELSLECILQIKLKHRGKHMNFTMVSILNDRILMIQ